MSKDKILKIGVFFGGASSENEISLESGRHIYNSLPADKYIAIPIYVDSNLKFWKIEEELIWMNSTSDIESNLKDRSKRIFYDQIKDEIDFAFIGLHGKYAEDGTLQGLFEILNIPFNGSGILGSALGMDKIFLKKVLEANSIKFAKYITAEINSYENKLGEIKKDVKEKLGYPCVVKPSREGCSTGITKVGKEENLEKALKEAFAWDNRVLIEEFLDFMEVTCTVLGNDEPYALTPTETPAKGDILTVEEKFLPGDAQMITPPRVGNEDVEIMKREFVRTYKALDLSVYTRIDAFWDKSKKELYINEPNTLPGVTPSTHVFHQAAEAGMNPSEFFDKIIAFSFDKFSKKTDL